MVGRLTFLAFAGLLNSLVIVRAATEAPKDNSTINPRLGLLASSLGVPPVPGASYGGGDDSGTVYTGGESTGTAYSVGGNYGPPVGPGPQPGPAPLKTCKCVPAKFCANPVKPGGVSPPYGGSTGGNYGGNGGTTGGGNYGPGPVGGTGGNYGPGPVGGTGGNYGGSNANAGATSGNYGGSTGGVTGGNYGGSNANAGATSGNYGGANGGATGGNYGGSNANAGANTGNYGGGLVEPSYPGTGGNTGGIVGGGDHHGGQPGGSYGGPEGQGTDGAGLIDIRIVNRPPGGPVACLGGEVYCCDEAGPGPYPGPNPGPSPIQGGQCGVRQIIPIPGLALEYGQAQFGAYPWMAVMLGPQNNYVGAGALIDSYHVLTAAHKIAEYKGGFKVRFGEWNAAADDEPHKNVEVDVARVDIHPAFNAQNLQNDVAIVTLAQPVSLDAYPHIKSVCLPQQGHQYDGQRCYVAGFGKDAFKVGKHSYILRDVDVPVVDSNECEQRLRGTRLGSYFNLNRKSFLCAGGEEGKDACTGDGGSPLVCEYNGRFSVVGLVAWGIGCADYGIPGVYVNVPNYVNWIESQISSPSPDLQGYARIKPKN